jgi:hypothetical protein
VKRAIVEVARRSSLKEEEEKGGVGAKGGVVKCREETNEEGRERVCQR